MIAGYKGVIQYQMVIILSPDIYYIPDRINTSLVKLDTVRAIQQFKCEILSFLFSVTD
jgi:hypothetical protein